MKRSTLTALFALVALAFAGCAAIDSSVISEHITTHKVADENNYFLVKAPMNDADDDFDPTQGVRIAIGKCDLEAETADYQFFRSPKPVTVLMYSFGRIVNSISLQGGIMVAKHPGIPKFCAYLDGDNDNDKVKVWVMTRHFYKEYAERLAIVVDGVESPIEP